VRFLHPGRFYWGVPDDSARQRVGNSLLRFDQPPTMGLWRPALAAYHP